MNIKEAIGGAAAVVLGMTVAFVTPPDGLTPQAMWALGIILWAVTCWIFEVAPDYVVAVAMCALWVLFKCVPFKTAFASFADQTWWLLLGALGMGAAVAKSGLLKRLSLWMMTIFPATFNGQVLALICGGTLIAPLIPSVTAKAAIMAPISMGISDAMGYARKSRGAGGLFAAMGLGFILTGPMFISASFIGFMVRGLLPADIQAQFNWTYWFLSGIVWSAVVMGLMYLAIRLLYTPDEKGAFTVGDAASQLTDLGPMSRREKTTAAVLLAALVFWMTEPLHGINATVVALLGLVVLLACKVFDRPDFRSDMGWDSLIFIGGIINLGNVLPALKIDQWIVSIFSPLIAPLMSNLYLFIVVLSLSIYAIRFILVSFTATTAIFTVVLVPFALQAGINPWVTGFLLYVSSNIWLAFYQNSTFLTAYYAVGGEMVTHRQIVPFSAAYCIVSIAASLLSVPFWQYLGLAP
ncbi:MAG: SLC13 family permease [Pseudomonadota bacterium]